MGLPGKTAHRLVFLTTAFPSTHCPCFIQSQTNKFLIKVPAIPITTKLPNILVYRLQEYIMDSCLTNPIPRGLWEYLQKILFAGTG